MTYADIFTAINKHLRLWARTTSFAEYVPRELQHARLVARDGITPELADAMLDAQASRDQRLAIADDVITNDGTLADLDARVRALHEQYLARALHASHR